jgi:hypothetical protein
MTPLLSVWLNEPLNPVGPLLSCSTKVQGPEPLHFYSYHLGSLVYSCRIATVYLFYQALLQKH